MSWAIVILITLGVTFTNWILYRKVNMFEDEPGTKYPDANPANLARQAAASDAEFLHELGIKET